MPRKKTTASESLSVSSAYKNPPSTLDEHQFYGIKLSQEQRNFANSIWSPQKSIIFCNSPAGTGKTMVAVGTALLLVDYGVFDKVVYVINPVQESRLGYLPGTLSDKISEYMAPFYGACDALGIDADRIVTSNIENLKSGTAKVELTSHVYFRGVTFGNSVIILDEAENSTVPEMKKILTRVGSDSKIIVIGHSGQCDLRNPRMSGFEKYIEWFRNEPYCAVHELKNNYRSIVAKKADEFQDTKENY